MLEGKKMPKNIVLEPDEDGEVTLYFSIQDGGDGSAYIMLMESAALCRIDQEFLEGWGEDCSGSITLLSNSPVLIQDDIVTLAEVMEETDEGDKLDALLALQEAEINKDPVG
jgi:hypothetical protein